MSDADLCGLDEIPDGKAKGFADPLGGADLFVVRQGDRVLGYRNDCPHLGTPLDWAPDTFMSLDGGHIQCSTHAALFQIEDGLCVSGPCEGDALTPVPVAVVAGRVVRRPD